MSAAYIYVTGSTDGALDGNTNNGGTDGFVSRYAPDRELEWTWQFGTTATDNGYGVAQDGDGNVYVVGDSSGALGSGSNQGSTDTILARVPATGVPHTWIEQFGSSGSDPGRGIVVDIVGNVYVTGYTNGDLDGNGPAADPDAFVAKHGSTGSQFWSIQVRSTGNETVARIATDGSGNVFVVGHTTGDFDGHDNEGGTDLFVLRMSPTSAVTWTNLLGTTAIDKAYDITLAGDAVYVSGSTEGTMPGGTYLGSKDVVLAKFATSDGTFQWASQWGTGGSDEGNGVAADNAGGVYVTGYTTGEMPANESAGGADVFVSRAAASSGGITWTRQLGTPESDAGADIDANNPDEVYIVGSSAGGLGGASSAGGSDVFVGRICPPGANRRTHATSDHNESHTARSAMP